jgi:hypothetical protein
MGSWRSILSGYWACHLSLDNKPLIPLHRSNHRASPAVVKLQPEMGGFNVIYFQYPLVANGSCFGNGCPCTADQRLHAERPDALSQWDIFLQNHLLNGLRMFPCQFNG